MYTKPTMDSNRVEGWDSNGIHCWSMCRYPSLGFVEENSTHIASVTRRTARGLISNDFRRYENADGKARFVMVSLTAGMDEDDPVVTYITDRDFFERFCKGMLDCGEIDKTDFDNLVKGLPAPPTAN